MISISPVKSWRICAAVSPLIAAPFQLDELQGVADSHGVVSGFSNALSAGTALPLRCSTTPRAEAFQCRRFLSSCGQQSGLVYLVDLAEMFRRVGFRLHVLFVYF